MTTFLTYFCCIFTAAFITAGVSLLAFLLWAFKTEEKDEVIRKKFSPKE